MHKEPTAVICLSPYSGGMELDAILFAKKLVPYTKTIMIVQKDHFIDKKLQEDSLTFETISFFKSISPSIIFRTRDIIKKHGIKNVVFFGASELKSLYFSFLGLNINLIIRHSTTKSRPKKDWFHKLIYSNVNYHISNSKHLENNVKHIIPFGKNSKSKFIYTSFNFNEPIKSKNDKTILVHTGRIAEGKGQIDAIKACEILYKQNIDFKLYIVGAFEKEYKKEFMNFFNTVEYKKNIELVGFTNEVSKYLRKGDIFIFPSYGEGLSLSFREALANNMVGISYKNTSFPELKEIGLKFHLVEDRNINALQETLLSVVERLNFEQEEVSGNYVRMKEIFSLEKEVNDYLEILE